MTPRIIYDLRFTIKGQQAQIVNRKSYIEGGSGMRLIVVGCGRVGARLSLQMSAEGHDVIVVDKAAAAFKRLGREFRGRTVTGIGFDRDVLREAGIERAD